MCFFLSSEVTDMEEEEAPAAPLFVGEMKEVLTVEGEEEESVQETAVTTATPLTTAAETTTGRTDIQEKEEDETDKITEDEEKMEEEENEAEMEEGEEENGEEEDGQAKKLMGVWESEVRTLEFDLTSVIHLSPFFIVEGFK